MSGNIAGVYGGAGFNTQTGEGMDNFDPLPAGWYTAMVDEAEVVQTKTGTGWYLKLRFAILDQQYNNRKIFKNINLRNPNQTAEEIGQKELTTFGRAINLPMINDSAECLNRPLMIKLKIVRDNEYGDKNEVNGYKHAGASAPQSAPQPTPAPAYAPPAQNAHQQAYPAPAPAPAAYAHPPQAAPQPTPAAPAGGGLPWKQNNTSQTPF